MCHENHPDNFRICACHYSIHIHVYYSVAIGRQWSHRLLQEESSPQEAQGSRYVPPSTLHIRLIRHTKLGRPEKLRRSREFSTMEPFVSLNPYHSQYHTSIIISTNPKDRSSYMAEAKVPLTYVEAAGDAEAEYQIRHEHNGR
jgi:hypothetical protein